MSTFDHVHPVILSGGSGTRLWPMSRDGQPKQLIKFIKTDDGRTVSLLELAAERAGNLTQGNSVYICTGERYREQIKGAMPHFDDAHILGEPMPRDTVNAVAFAAAVLPIRLYVIRRNADQYRGNRTSPL